jgi:hypothetical protein
MRILYLNIYISYVGKGYIFILQVVDERLRVYGIQGLRVVDASGDTQHELNSTVKVYQREVYVTLSFLIHHFKVARLPRKI